MKKKKHILQTLARTQLYLQANKAILTSPTVLAVVLEWPLLYPAWEGRMLEVSLGKGTFVLG